jgi:hypothetical protein
MTDAAHEGSLVEAMKASGLELDALPAVKEQLATYVKKLNIGMPGYNYRSADGSVDMSVLDSILNDSYADSTASEEQPIAVRTSEASAQFDEQLHSAAEAAEPAAGSISSAVAAVAQRGDNDFGSDVSDSDFSDSEVSELLNQIQTGNLSDDTILLFNETAKLMKESGKKFEKPEDMPEELWSRVHERPKMFLTQNQATEDGAVVKKQVEVKNRLQIFDAWQKMGLSERELTSLKRNNVTDDDTKDYDSDDDLEVKRAMRVHGSNAKYDPADVMDWYDEYNGNTPFEYEKDKHNMYRQIEDLTFDEPEDPHDFHVFKQMRYV